MLVTTSMRTITGSENVPAGQFALPMPSPASTLPRVSPTPTPGIPDATIVNWEWTVLARVVAVVHRHASIVYVPGAVA